MQLAVGVVVRNKTTGRTLKLNLPSAWDGDDLTLDWYRRTIEDQDGLDRSALLDPVDNSLWLAREPLLAGSNSVEVEAVRGSTVAGPALPQSAATDSSFGTAEWGEVNGIKSEDAAAAQVSGGNGATVQSRYLLGKNFDLKPSSGATVKGITTTLKCSRTSTPGGAVGTNRLRLVRKNIILPTDRTAGASWPVSPSTAETSHGGAADLWGTEWVPADFDSEFGFALAVNLTASSGFNVSAMLQWAKVAVNYQDAAMVATLRWEKGYY